MDAPESCGYQVDVGELGGDIVDILGMDVGESWERGFSMASEIETYELYIVRNMRRQRREERGVGEKVMDENSGMTWIGHLFDKSHVKGRKGGGRYGWRSLTAASRSQSEIRGEARVVESERLALAGIHFRARVFAV